MPPKSACQTSLLSVHHPLRIHLDTNLCLTFFPTKKEPEKNASTSSYSTLYRTAPKNHTIPTVFLLYYLSRPMSLPIFLRFSVNPKRFLDLPFFCTLFLTLLDCLCFMGCVRKGANALFIAGCFSSFRLGFYTETIYAARQTAHKNDMSIKPKPPRKQRLKKRAEDMANGVFITASGLTKNKPPKAMLSDRIAI